MCILPISITKKGLHPVDILLPHSAMLISLAPANETVPLVCELVASHQNRRCIAKELKKYALQFTVFAVKTFLKI